MQALSPSGQQAVDQIATQTGFSPDAVLSMLVSVMNGNGSMAQFNHPEFSGSGQWMRGGMTMVSDMFNNHLKGRVDGLCQLLSDLLARQGGLFVAPASGSGSGAMGSGPGQSDWWPSDLRWPDSTGAQNNQRYAWFSQARRLAVDNNGQVTVYDTQNHLIGGVSQQQSGSGSISFSSQFGLVDLASLPVVSGPGAGWSAAPPASPVMPSSRADQTSTAAANLPASVDTSLPSPSPSPVGAQPTSADDIFNMLDKLAALQARGVITDDEFKAKKAELMSRL